MPVRTKRKVAVTLLTSVLVVLAGCSGALSPDDSSGNDATTTAADELETETDATTTEQESTENDSETSTDGETTLPDDNATGEANATGRLFVAIDGHDTDLANASSSANADFWVETDAPHTWHAANDSLTLGDALDELDVDANDTALTHDGTTYRDSDDGTNVSYRVNGEVVEDPETYELDADDQVIVTVHTPNATTPGQYFDSSNPHPHGSLSVTVNGHDVNFTESKHAMADEYFHFHGDEGARKWHAHSHSLTLTYAISTFPGLNATNDAITYENETFSQSDEDVNVTFTVNGESVDPSTYVLKDGDDVEVVVTESE